MKATSCAVIFGLLALAACKESGRASSSTRTTGAPVATTLSAAACESEAKRNDPGCDWYYDPMRMAAAADAQ